MTVVFVHSFCNFPKDRTSDTNHSIFVDVRDKFAVEFPVSEISVFEKNFVVFHDNHLNLLYNKR